MNNIIRIDRINIPELTIYKDISEKKLLRINEPAPGLFIGESPKVIKRAIDAGYEPLSFLTEWPITDDAMEIIKEYEDLPVYAGDFDLLKEMTGYPLARGLLSAMRRKPLANIEDITANARRIVIIEDVENPTNVGSIFRNAAALNIDAVILTKGSSDPLYRRSARVSMGTVFQIPWTFLPKKAYNRQANISYVQSLKALGFKTAVMALTDKSVNIDDPALNSEDKLAIIMGNEGDGVIESTLSESDYTVCIPMSHNVDSLNVAAASAIAFYQLTRTEPDHS